MHRRILSAALLLGAACATTPKTAETVETRERISNRSPFDIAYCHPGTGVPMPATATAPGLIGALLTTEPLVLECLVDPANRGEAAETVVTLTTTVDATGATHDATGENLTDAGRACITGKLEEALRLPAVAEGKPAVKGEIKVVHRKGENPTVTLGINQPSDIFAAIRLGQQGWCDCYPDATATPPTVRAEFEVLPDATGLTNVTFVPVSDAVDGGAQEAGDAALTACLTEKLSALQVAPAAKHWKLPYVFEHGNAYAAAPAPNASPFVQFQHHTARRSQAQARAAMAAGDADIARGDYDALVSRYQKNSKSVSIKQLVDGCKRLVDADDAFISALEKLRSVGTDTQAFANAQVDSDSQWSDVVSQATEAVAKTDADLAAAKAQRESDNKACPKVRL